MVKLLIIDCRSSRKLLADVLLSQKVSLIYYALKLATVRGIHSMFLSEVLSI